MRSPWFLPWIGPYKSSFSQDGGIKAKFLQEMPWPQIPVRKASRRRLERLWKACENSIMRAWINHYPFANNNVLGNFWNRPELHIFLHTRVVDLAPDQTFHVVYGIPSVHGSLAFGSISDQSFAVVECNPWWSGAVPLELKSRKNIGPLFANY